MSKDCLLLFEGVKHEVYCFAQGCGKNFSDSNCSKFFGSNADSICLKFSDSNSDSRIFEKQTPTLEHLKNNSDSQLRLQQFKKTTPTPTPNFDFSNSKKLLQLRLQPKTYGSATSTPDSDSTILIKSRF